MADNKRRKINELLMPVVEGMGYEFVGCECLERGSVTVLRIFIDNDSGITLDDCSKISKQLSAVLDVEEPIVGKYTFEVSSPGIDRPLFTIEHYERFKGHKASIHMQASTDGRRNYKGVIVDVRDGFVVIDVDGKEFSLRFDLIGKANLCGES